MADAKALNRGILGRQTLLAELYNIIGRRAAALREDQRKDRILFNITAVIRGGYDLPPDTVTKRQPICGTI